MPDPREPSLPPELEAQLWEIVDLPADARGVVLEHWCKEHAAHAALGRSFLDRHATAGDRSGAPAGEPQQLGPYRILEKIGEGGMGVVYLAEQRRPVRRRVALKVIKPGMDSKAVLARFEAERQALALMEHSSIARVYDCGATDRGQPWFAMEFVKGIPITDYCDQHRLPLEQRIELFQRVCSGVQHAHLKGVMHRDLKPSNVLVTLQDGMPAPKVIDFGLARAVDHRLVEATLFTEQGVLIGTPEYMSPEQAGLGGLDVDTRTDVYALGVLLYELLTGSLPFSRRELRDAGLLSMQRVIRETEPQKPSTKVTTLGDAAAECARVRGVDVSGLRKSLRGDLDWIVLRALEKDRTRRYQTALELADDLGRHLRLDPVEARPPSWGYRASRFVRRYRVQVAAAGLVLAALVAGGVGIWGQWRRAEALAATLRPWSLLAGPVLLEDAIARRMEGQSIDGEGLLALLPQVEAELGRLAQVAQPDAAQKFLSSSLEKLRQALGGEFERRVRIDVSARNHPNARVSWEEARRAIARADGVVSSELYSGKHSRYHPIDLQPQAGLVPIGMNPVTRLWEFYELGSAWDGTGDPAALPIPVHAPDGRIEVTGGTGIVFVLLPGGTFWMGAQKDDPKGPNFDPDAIDKDDEFNRLAESPVHEVSLAPFFLARHELTEGQRRRLGVERVSAREAHERLRLVMGDAYSVVLTAAPERSANVIDWADLLRAGLRCAGLRVPTEAQWEYGCRAGTTTPFCCPREDVERCSMSVLDTERRQGPVLSLPPNAFGLHDMHGSLGEVSLDVAGSYRSGVRAGDGHRLQGAGNARVLRDAGGLLENRRSAARMIMWEIDGGMGSASAESVGLRVARRLMP